MAKISITNNLNIWDPSKSNSLSSSGAEGLSAQTECSGGFQAGNYLKSNIFNTILYEVSYVTKSFINALASNSLNYDVPSASSIIADAGNTGSSSADLTTAIVGILNGLKTAASSNADTATTAGKLSGGSTGSLVYQSAANTTSFLALGSSGNILTVGSNSAPKWTSPNDISVKYATSAGSAGTATTATSANYATSAGSASSAGTASECSGNSATATKSTNIAGGSAGSIPYQTSANNTGMLSIGSNNNILTSNGSTPQWTARTSVTVGYANDLSGGTAGDLPYQDGTDSTVFLVHAGANRMLTSTSNGMQWEKKSDVTVGSANTASNALKINSKNFNLSYDSVNKVLTIEYYE